MWKDGGWTTDIPMKLARVSIGYEDTLSSVRPSPLVANSKYGRLISSKGGDIEEDGFRTKEVEDPNDGGPRIPQAPK